MEEESQTETAAPSISNFSSKLRAMVRIRRKYQVMKKRRAELGGELPRSGLLPRPTGPEIFTFDQLPVSGGSPRKRKKKKRNRVMFPNDGRRYLPAKERSRAKNCLFLLSIIVCVQVYNAIENLDDHLQRYDLEGLEKTLKREVFGQREAAESILELLSDYLSTYVHNKPLVISINGPSGVGKSHLGRILARHFRSVASEELVLQYFMLHHCPLEENAPHCAQELATRISDMVNRAEAEEKIPVFIFDEVEFMHSPLLEYLQGFFRANQTNEYLNAVYVLISNIGQAEITKFVLQNSSSNDSLGKQKLTQELGRQVKRSLVHYHPLWADTDVVPMWLLEKSHVMECFLDEMTREGFYPDTSHIERLAAEISYYTAGNREYSRNGCKQVVGKVNLL
ncbi:TOR4A protein, partial [Amia calva]|nr:TOR4A protein [Amia calva]